MWQKLLLCCSVSLWLMWVNVQSACALNTNISGNVHKQISLYDVAAVSSSLQLTNPEKQQLMQLLSIIFRNFWSLAHIIHKSQWKTLGIWNGIETTFFKILIIKLRFKLIYSTHSYIMKVHLCIQFSIWTVLCTSRLCILWRICSLLSNGSLLGKDYNNVTTVEVHC
jgi:hypothetical protein